MAALTSWVVSRHLAPCADVQPCAYKARVMLTPRCRHAPWAEQVTLLEEG